MKQQKVKEAALLARTDLIQEGFTEEELDLDPSFVERRIAQQELVKSIPGIVSLDKAGSQRANYDLDENGKLKNVYYASYGSNLFVERFSAYIEGGQPEGSARADVGCRDKTLPTENLPVALNGTIHYAGESKVWTGGPAFLDTSTSGKSLGRAYRVTASQFEDVVAQECDYEVGSKNIDFNKVIDEGKLVESGIYGTLVHAGDYNNAPVFTFTSAFTTKQARSGKYTISPDGDLIDKKDAKPIEQKVEGEKVKDHWDVFSNAPAEAYKKKIAAGLKETHGLTDAQAEVYFNGSTGAMPLNNSGR